MAEPQPDLDDFFAKKDRKKTKKKFPTPTELAATIPKPKKVETTSAITTTTTTSNTPQDVEEEVSEWLDYKEEQEKDYSGLKLRQLAEPEPEPEEETDDNQPEDQNPVEPAWKPVAPGSETAAPVAAAPAAAGGVANLKDEPNKNVYISPALRNAALLGPSKLKSKAAPDLGSDAFFPALGTEPPKPVVLGKLTPSSGHGGRPAPRAWGPPAGQPASSVSLGNRFNTLDQEDS